MGNEKTKIPIKKILIIIKEILEIIIAGIPEEEAITKVSKKYNVDTNILKKAFKKYRK